LTIDRSANTIVRIVNNAQCPLSLSAAIVRAYVALTAATIVVLAVLSAAAPREATAHAWGHGIVVAVFALVLPLRLRAARAGQRSGLRALGIISGALLVVNVVEATLPGFVPVWMRVEMWGVAALMAANVLLVVRAALAD